MLSVYCPLSKINRKITTIFSNLRPLVFQKYKPLILVVDWSSSGPDASSVIAQAKRHNKMEICTEINPTMLKTVHQHHHLIQMQPTHICFAQLSQDLNTMQGRPRYIRYPNCYYLTGFLLVLHPCMLWLFVSCFGSDLDLFLSGFRAVRFLAGHDAVEVV
jgi:hypothetical protein